MAVAIRTISVNRGGQYKAIQVVKFGQDPPPSIVISPDLEKRLGEQDAELYKKALVSRNQGYGIGALAYVRRVVENKTNELIEVVAADAASHGVATAEEVEKIRAAKDDKIPFDERLRLASEAIPSKLKPDGANPLSAMYDLLSKGLHAKTDEECLKIVDEIGDVFEYTFSRLQAEIEDRNAVMSKIKKWVGGRGKQE